MSVKGCVTNAPLRSNGLLEILGAIAIIATWYPHFNGSGLGNDKVNFSATLIKLTYPELPVASRSHFDL